MTETTCITCGGPLDYPDLEPKQCADCQLGDFAQPPFNVLPIFLTL